MKPGCSVALRLPAYGDGGRHCRTRGSCISAEQLIAGTAHAWEPAKVNPRRAVRVEKFKVKSEEAGEATFKPHSEDLNGSPGGITRLGRWGERTATFFKTTFGHGERTGCLTSMREGEINEAMDPRCWPSAPYFA